MRVRFPLGAQGKKKILVDMQNELETYLEIAQNKVKNPTKRVFILAILAGVLIALAGAIATMTSYAIDNASVKKLVSAAVFPIGLILVIFFQTELFTGNNLLLIAWKRKKITIKELLRNWGIVYAGNLIGGFLTALSLYFVWLENSGLREAMANTANYKVGLSWWQAIILGFWCNFLVCLAVYFGVTKKTFAEKIGLIFLPVFAFIALGFEHSVANMFYLSFGGLLAEVSLGQIVVSLAMVTLGNILGGGLLSLVIDYKSGL